MRETGILPAFFSAQTFVLAPTGRVGGDRAAPKKARGDPVPRPFILYYRTVPLLIFWPKYAKRLDPRTLTVKAAIRRYIDSQPLRVRLCRENSQNLTVKAAIRRYIDSQPLRVRLCREKLPKSYGESC
jgi:hypothetical protein